MNSLLQEALLGTEHIAQAAIIRRKDGVVKARSSGLTLTSHELQTIHTAFVHPVHVREHGFAVGEVMYKAVRADEFSIYAKNEKAGVIIARTANFVILGTYDATMQPSIAVEAVEKLADYFREKGK